MTTVRVHLGKDPKSGIVSKTAPILVMSDGEPPGAWLYENEPEIVAQFYDGEHEARFEAEW